MKAALLILVLGAFLVAVCYMAFSDFDASVMSVHGWVALGLGTVLSLALGGGLMALVFFSARKGYDDRVARDESED